MKLRALTLVCLALAAVSSSGQPASNCIPPVITHIGFASNTFALSFQSQTGFTYRVENKAALENPVWLPVQSILAIGTNTPAQDLLTGGNRFYRIVCLGPLAQPVTPFEPPQTPPAQPGAPTSCSEGQDDSLPYLFSGEFHSLVKDLVIKGRGMDLIWSRHYRSKAGTNTTLGNGWDFSYNIRVQANGTNFDVFDGTGRSDTYRLQLDGTYAADQLFCEGTLSNTVFALKFPDAGTWEFFPLDGSANEGKIHYITDRNDNQLNFSYDLSGRLSDITDTLGRNIHLSYNPDGFISTLTDFAGRQVSYAYYQNGDAGGSFGDLKSITSPAVTNTPNGNDFPSGKTVIYTYSKNFSDNRLNHNLLTITDAKGQTWLRNTYASTTNVLDFNFDRLLSQSRGNSNQVLSFFYTFQTPTLSNQFAISKAIINDRVGNVSEYLYDATNRLLSLKQFTGRAVPGIATTETQNRPTGKLRLSDPAYFETDYQWNEDSKAIQILYPNGNYVQNTYELTLSTNISRRFRGNLRARTSFPGALSSDQSSITETFVYDTSFGGCCGFNFVTQSTDGRTNTTFHFYDSHGNRTNTIHAESSSVEDFEYNSFGQMTAHVLPDNGSGYRQRDVMTYYTNGPQAGYLSQRIEDSQTLALTTSYEYDAVGNAIRTIDPQGSDLTNVFNQLNQLVREQSRSINTTNGPVRYQRDYRYDANNNLVQIDLKNVDENGVVSGNAEFTTTYAYDVLNFPTNFSQEVDPTHSVTIGYAYDANRNRILMRSGEATSGSQSNNVVSMLYDERNLPFHQIRAPSDPGKATTQFDYDANGNLIRMIQGIEDLITPRITSYTYDGYNRRITSVDGMNNVTTTHYDANGNVASLRVDGELNDLPSGTNNVRLSESTNTYDLMNRLAQTDQSFFEVASGTNIASGHAITRMIYSGNSQMLQSIDANGRTNTVTYDTANRRSQVVDAKANSTTYTYDPNGNVVLTTEVDISDLGNPSETFFTTNSYDGLDRIVQTSDNLGNTTQFGYDSRNNKTVFTDGRGNLTRYTYDGLSRLIATTHSLTSNGQGNGAPAGSIVTTQTWDDNSRLTGQIDANSNLTAYVYDPLDRQIRTVFGDGTINVVSYDRHDNAVITTDANSNVVNATYDLLNRLATRAITRGAGVSGVTSETYQYDGLSRVVLAQNNDAQVARSYDSLGQTIRETEQLLGGPARTNTCTHDALGNMLSCNYPGGRAINTTYDSLNRKQTISDGAGTIATYSYLGRTRTERRDYGNGTRAAYAYDGVRRMTNSLQSVISGGAPIDSRSYSWDAGHNKTAATDLLVPSVDSKSFGYDSVSRLVESDTAFSGPNISYNLDGAGNRLSVIGGANAGSYFMNPASPPTDFQVNQYTTTPFDTRGYDANGNLTNAGLQRFVYDYRNRLVSASRFDGISTYTNTLSAKYDCFDRRIEKASPTNTTRYYYDGWQEIEEQDGTDVTVATYAWGNSIDELLSMNRNSQNYFYHTDNSGSVQKVTDGSGNLVEQYRYADFGAPSVFNGGGSPVAVTQIGNATLFEGRRYDAETGLCYFRTRYLEPDTGRFTTRDSIGVWGDPMNEGNSTAYVGNNPESRIDPFGLASVRLSNCTGCSAPKPDCDCTSNPNGTVSNCTCVGSKTAAFALASTQNLFLAQPGPQSNPNPSSGLASIRLSSCTGCSAPTPDCDCTENPNGTVSNCKCVGSHAAAFALASIQNLFLARLVPQPKPDQVFGLASVRLSNCTGCSAPTPDCDCTENPNGTVSNCKCVGSHAAAFALAPIQNLFPRAFTSSARGQSSNRTFGK